MPRGACGLAHRVVYQGVAIVSFRTGALSSHPGVSGFLRALRTPAFCALLFVSVLFGAAFLRLGAEVHEAETLPADQRILDAIDGRTASWPVAIPSDVSLLASEAVIGVAGLALAGWFLLRRRQLDALFVIGAVGGYVALTLIVKHLVQRERPVAFSRPRERLRLPERAYPGGDLPRVRSRLHPLARRGAARPESTRHRCPRRCGNRYCIESPRTRRPLPDRCARQHPARYGLDERADRAPVRRRTVAVGRRPFHACRRVTPRASAALCRARARQTRYPLRQDEAARDAT